MKVKNSFKLPVSEKVKKSALDVKEKKEKVKSVAGVKEGAKKERKMKRLSQVKTPSALKKKKKISTPKRVTKTINSPKRTVKKSRFFKLQFTDFFVGRLTTLVPNNSTPSRKGSNLSNRNLPLPLSLSLSSENAFGLFRSRSIFGVRFEDA
ncbi:hypothetical protein CKAN_02351900 [Cinnamomum micranthum f. kanehirae]|uniref:Uncharacterized protein n=1 Tax=Cinnamomum micranthum f. kanehirae TaxID=337451 RepID=A0A443PTX8_9MAGN|nr:hypothetical protein CKAN_02351900 [Cinnamomum micranthum f. kanehirae]